MKLISLLNALEIPTDVIANFDPGVEITGISHDTRDLQAGEVFIALSGGSFDGHKFIGEAIRKEAALIVCESELEIDIPYIKVTNTRKALARFAAAFYGFPAKDLTVIGVTGTDGKTTTVNLIHHMLVSCGIKAGMVSTVNARIGNLSIDTGFHVTTPEAQKIQAILKEMVENGLSHVVLEATSHGLAQSRVDECYFDIGVVTNITHEHLDYHGDYDNYLRSKAKLFTGLIHNAVKPLGIHQKAILNCDDISYEPLNTMLADDEFKDIHKITYGSHAKNDLIAENIKNTVNGIAFDLLFRNKKYPVVAPLIGEYNVSNIMAAIGAVVAALGLDIGQAIKSLESFPGVPGRMEILHLGQNFTAIVDFAHTPNALKVALETSRKRTDKRVIAVFGSAGLRDREKRRMMAATSLRCADITILTAEDPRTEELSTILSEMEDEAIKEGGVKGKTFFTVPDRGEAIRQAVNIATNDDLVIICGKGHEQSMCFGEIEYPWDDRIALKSVLSDLMGLEGPQMPYLPTQDK